jgi:hypothetical protein
MADPDVPQLVSPPNGMKRMTNDAWPARGA